MRPIDADNLRGRVCEKFLCAEPGSAEERRFAFILGLIDSEHTITPPPNVPLTLEELREMDGEPVWWWKPKRKAIASICIFNGVMSGSLLLSYDFIEDIVNLKTYQYLIDRGYKPYLRKPEEKRKDTDG